MGTVNRLIEEKGNKVALRANLDQRIVGAAAQYMADQEQGIGFAFNVAAQEALLHRRLVNDAVWHIHAATSR